MKYISTNLVSTYVDMQFNSSVFHIICSLKLKTLFLLLGIWVSLPPSAEGQLSNILEKFSLVQNGNTVIANFSIVSGASCNSVTLERRLADDSTFQEAGVIQGVCGGSEFIEHYSIVDESPNLGALNNYRLILGFTGKSSEVVILVIELNNEYTLFPQPMDEEVFVKFNNPNNEAVTLRVFDAQGKRVKELKGINNDLIFIDGSSLGSGLFIFQIEFTSSRLISGKFIRLAN
ncbi:MAG: T9SS type A sorting domain-containing protein [Flavobacteriales bacterium]